MTTPNLSLPELVASQSQPHLTLNQGLRRLDALVQLTVISISNTPPGSPADGDRYIVGTAPTGAWAGHDEKIAAYIGGGWTYWTPAVGWLAFVQSLAAFYVFGSGSPASWAEFAAGGGGGGGIEPLETAEYFNEFNYVTSSQHTTYGGWYTTWDGGNSVGLATSEPGHPGILQHNLSNGTYTINLYGTGTGGGYNNFQLGTDVTIEMEWLIRCQVLPNGTDTFYIFFGFAEQNNAQDAIRVYLERESGVVKWRLETRNNGTSTNSYDNVASNPPVANQWHHLKLVCTPTAVDLYVDGVLTLTNTTNITTDPMTIYNTGVKTAGSNSRYIDIDYVRVRVTKTPDRSG
jgi:hypothetical protein